MTTGWELPPLALDEARAGLWVVDGVVSAKPVAGALRLPGRFALPGLVDAHTHVAIRDARPVGIDAVRDQLRAMLATGVTTVRDLGSPGSLTLLMAHDRDLPAVVSAGRWLAVEGKFFPDWHDPVAPAGLVAAAIAEVERGATWVKVVTDWADTPVTYPMGILAELVREVHARGARVAAHANGSMDVIETGVDSIEHGGGLDGGMLRAMAERGTAWVPTLTADEAFYDQIVSVIADAEQDPTIDDAYERAWRPKIEAGLAGYRRNVPIAASLGIPLLAGTDRYGTIADAVDALVRYGLDPAHAVRAASTDARAYLRLPGLEPGAPGDVVTYDADPRDDVSVLASPVAILLHGRRVA